LSHLKTAIAVLAIIAATIAVSAGIIMFTGKSISDMHIKDGTVVSKRFVEEYTKDERHCIPVGRIMSCSTRPTYHDDYWEVVITNEKDGKPVSRGIEVTEDQYNSLNEGDYFNSEPDAQ
jgi:hypothetical protein